MLAISTVKNLALIFFPRVTEEGYHLKKTKPLSEAQKEAVCIVNMVRGIKVFSLGSDGSNILMTGRLTTWLGMESL